MSVKNNYPKDNSNGWYGSCEVDFKELQKENEKLSKQLEFSIQANIEAELLEKAALRNAYEELKEENDKLKEHKLNREEQITKIADIVGYDYPNIDNNNKLIDMIENLKKQIPAKKGKKLSQADKELLIEIDDRITWGDGDRWIERRKLIDRLLK